MTYSVDTYKAALIAAHNQLTGLLDEYEDSEIRFDGGDAIIGRLEMIGKSYFRALEPWINGTPETRDPLAHMKRAIDALEGGPGTPGYEFFKEFGRSATPS